MVPFSRFTPGPPGSVGRDSSTGNLCFESASVALRPRIQLVFTPLELLARLAALVPCPGKNGISYHGVLGARSRLRRLVVPPPPQTISLGKLTKAEGSQKHRPWLYCWAANECACAPSSCPQLPSGYGRGCRNRPVRRQRRCSRSPHSRRAKNTSGQSFALLSLRFLPNPWKTALFGADKVSEGLVVAHRGLQEGGRRGQSGFSTRTRENPSIRNPLSLDPAKRRTR
jgi:hypothetical protein